MPPVEWPPNVREYLRTRDSFTKAELERDDPGLLERLSSGDALVAAGQWLTDDEATDEQNLELTLGCLELLAGNPQSADPAVVRALVVADSPTLRRASYEVLFAGHFRAGERRALTELITSMLRDPSDRVRAMGVSYLERADLLDDMQPLLRRWLTSVAARESQDSESYELVVRLLGRG